MIPILLALINSFTVIIPPPPEEILMGSTEVLWGDTVITFSD